ncbi:MAG: HlyD family efflux transporter periplasmic adaptor subunit [Pseudomonadota bacterium]
MDRPVQRRAHRFWIGAAIAIVAVAGGAFALRSLEPTTSFTLDGQRLRIAEVSEGTYEDFIPLRASVEPQRTVFLDAIEGGRVEDVLVEEGAFVEAGQPLVELSNTTLQLEVIARESEISEQLNNLRNTELAIEQNRLSLKSDLVEIDYQITRLSRLVARYETLEGRQFLSNNEYQESKDELAYWRARREVTRESQEVDERIRLVQVDQLRNSVSQLERNLALAREKLDMLMVRAPRDGHLTSLNAELGESKAPGERLGQIDDVDGFKASALVNEFYVGQVRLGQQAVFTDGGREYGLEISKIYPEVQGAQFRVDLGFLGSAPTDIRRGQTLQLRLQLGDSQGDAVLLANGPFFNDTGGAWAFVLDADGTAARRRPVQFGRRNPNRLEVEAGLVPGDRVIVSSYATFIDVDRLQIER